jgi:DNA-directed RNA polymerase subunit RPC12/RpoP
VDFFRSIDWSLLMSISAKRNWKCPECGSEVQLSMTQLDPIACEVCLSRMKGNASSNKTVAEASAGPLAVWQALPDSTKLVVVAAAFVIGLLLGLTGGFIAGKAGAPRLTSGGHESSGSIHVEKEEERPDPPGPGYRWNRGRERKDGTRGPGHWSKDPFYKGEEAPTAKKK